VNELETIKRTENRKQSNGELFNDDELNEWGYPSDMYVFAGCETTRVIVREEIYQEGDEEDKKPLFEEVLHITYTNYYHHCKATENEQDRISYILDDEDTEDAALFNTTMKLYASNLLARMTVPQLKAHCKERGLKVGGKKADLISRLKEYVLQGHDKLVGEEE
tara:strand:+ start:59 stop:550 length:492 start_codon:yes stop_codon:yes gene_type:complete